MNTNRRLIVNADDFGLTAGINRGILESHRSGIVTSTSLMVRRAAASNAVEIARQYPALSVGLHIDLGEWVYRDEEWVRKYEVVDCDDSSEVELEILKQLEGFRKLMGKNPTHIDSHQHVHQNEPVRTISLRIANALRVPLRGLKGEIAYVGVFYGQDKFGASFPENLSSSILIETIMGTRPGVSELGCHPGFANDLDSAYAIEREREIVALCDPGVRAAVAANGIQLCSFDSINPTE